MKDAFKCTPSTHSGGARLQVELLPVGKWGFADSAGDGDRADASGTVEEREMEMECPQATVTVHPNGGMDIVKCGSEYDAYRAGRLVAACLKRALLILADRKMESEGAKLKFKELARWLCFRNFAYKGVTAQCDMRFAVDLDSLALAYPKNAKWTATDSELCWHFWGGKKPAISIQVNRMGRCRVNAGAANAEWQVMAALDRLYNRMFLHQY